MPSHLWSVVTCSEILCRVIFANDGMGTLITPWHGDHDIRCNRSQLVSIEFKSGPSYGKHTIGGCHGQ